MTKVTWIGEPGGPESIEQYGFTFPQGKSVDVPASNPHIGKFRGNRFFEVEPQVDDGDLTYNPVHKGRGRYVVTGPEGTPDYGPFSKEEAVAKAAELNRDAATPVTPAAEVPLDAAP